MNDLKFTTCGEYMTQKIVINRCFGGFSLSGAAQRRYFELEQKHPGEYDPQYDCWSEWETWDVHRDDYNLIRVVEELGETSWGYGSELKVVEIPEDVDWYIQDYDGVEQVHETHRSWY
jgi:hypothetical protein